MTRAATAFRPIFVPTLQFHECVQGYATHVSHTGRSGKNGVHVVHLVEVQEHRTALDRVFKCAKKLKNVVELNRNYAHVPILMFVMMTGPVGLNVPLHAEMVQYHVNGYALSLKIANGLRLNQIIVPHLALANGMNGTSGANAAWHVAPGRKHEHAHAPTSSYVMETVPKQANALLMNVLFISNGVNGANVLSVVVVENGNDSETVRFQISVVNLDPVVNYRRVWPMIVL
jgi:hypothetical protein